MSRCIPGMIQKPTIEKSIEWWNKLSYQQKYDYCEDHNIIFGTKFTPYYMSNKSIQQIYSNMVLF